MRFVAGRVHRGGEAGRGAVAESQSGSSCWPRRRGETVAGRGADADGWGLPGRDATGRGAPLRNGRARRGAEASGRGFRQASARLATACTAGKEMHDGRGVARRTSTAAPGQLGAWLANACRVTFVWVVRLGDTSCLLLPLGRQGFGAAVCLWRSSGRGGTLLL